MGTDNQLVTKPKRQSVNPRGFSGQECCFSEERRTCHLKAKASVIDCQLIIQATKPIN